jgi:hypothetical protein
VRLDGARRGIGAVAPSGAQQQLRGKVEIVQLDLADFEYVDLDRAVRRGQQDRGRLHGFSPAGRAEHLELRQVAETPVDDVQIDGWRGRDWRVAPTQPPRR